MNILTMGTATSYVKNMALNIKWQERKNNPLKPKEDVTTYKDSVIADLERQRESNERSQKIEAIKSKLFSGQKLNSDEPEYLRENSPEDYENAVKAEKEREEYKRELASCRSKEDVANLNIRRLQRFGAEARTVANNQSIPLEKKKVLLEGIFMRMAAIQDEHREFVKTPEYQKLPEKTDDEQEEDASYVAEEEAFEEDLPDMRDSQDPIEDIKMLLTDLLSTESAALTPEPEAQSTKTENSVISTGTYNSKGIQSNKAKPSAASMTRLV